MSWAEQEWLRSVHHREAEVRQVEGLSCRMRVWIPNAARMLPAFSEGWDFLYCAPRLYFSLLIPHPVPMSHEFAFLGSLSICAQDAEGSTQAGQLLVTRVRKTLANHCTVHEESLTLSPDFAFWLSSQLEPRGMSGQDAVISGWDK